MAPSTIKSIKSVRLCVQAILETIQFQKLLLSYKAMDEKEKKESLSRSDKTLLALINRKKFLQDTVSLYS